MICGLSAAISDEPARNELGIGIERNPRPNIACACAFPVIGNVLRLCVTETPNFITLDSFAPQIFKNAVLIVGTFASEIHQQVHYRCAMNASHPCNGAK